MRVQFHRIHPFAAVVLMVLPPLSAYSQQMAENTCPADQPGVYVQDSTNWRLLAQTQPVKMKAKHAFLSSMSYGAVSAPMIVEYAGPHAKVQVAMARPTICVSHIMTSAQPILVRLNEKKKSRELDSGSVRAVPFANDSVQGHATEGSIVPTKTSSTYGETLLEPQADLAPGEYAVMFGAQNLAVLDFGVQPSQQQALK